MVFHCATAAPTAANAANLKLMDAVNVQGTRSVVEACARHGVSRLVYTSSASVVFDGSPLVKVDESTPYAARHMDYYTGTKAQGGQGFVIGRGRACVSGGGAAMSGSSHGVPGMAAGGLGPGRSGRCLRFSSLSLQPPSMTRRGGGAGS